MTAKLAILPFTYKKKNVQSIHLRMDNMVVLKYLVKMNKTKFL